MIENSLIHPISRRFFPLSFCFMVVWRLCHVNYFGTEARIFSTCDTGYAKILGTSFT